MKAKLDKARQGEARQGKVRQGKANDEFSGLLPPPRSSFKLNSLSPCRHMYMGGFDRLRFIAKDTIFVRRKPLILCNVSLRPPSKTYSAVVTVN